MILKATNFRPSGVIRYTVARKLVLRKEGLVLWDMTQYSLLCRLLVVTCCSQLKSCNCIDLGIDILRTSGKIYTAQDGVISHQKGKFQHRPDNAKHPN
jgi:hypothetical protein